MSPRLRMRVAASNTNQLELPLEAESRYSTDRQGPQLKSFVSDLEEVRSGRLTFTAFARRHRKLVTSVAKPWMFRCTQFVGLEDLVQELFIEIWRGLETWQPEYAVPLTAYVRLKMYNKLLGYTHKLMRNHRKDGQYLNQQIIEEKVLVIQPDGSTDGAYFDTAICRTFVPVCPGFDVTELDAPRVAARIVGMLPTKQARVVAGLLVGESPDTVTKRVYGSKCKGQRKAALRAISAAAAVLVKAS